MTVRSLPPGRRRRTSPECRPGRVRGAPGWPWPGSARGAGRRPRRAGQDAPAAASFSSGPSSSRAVMILSRLPATCLFISATRACPAASAAVMICRVACRWAWCCGRNSAVRHEHRAGQTRVCMRAGFDQGQLAVAVRQRLGGAGQLLFRPGGVAERPVGADLDGLALGVDLAGSFPVLADGLIGQPRVMSGHERRVVIEYLLHDMLRDVPVDQDRSQRVAPLVGG